MNKVSIYGGLGNQMFQFAFSKALNKYGHKATISFSGFLHYKHHNGFDLARAFDLKLPVHLKLLKFILFNAGLVYRNRIAASFFRRSVTWYDAKKNTYKEKREFEFDEHVFQQKNAFFVGTWQSVFYLKGVEENIKNEFIFNEPSDEVNKKLVEKIKGCNAVSIHIRRGDYLSAHWQSILCVIKSTDYYEGAIRYIGQHVTAPNYFVFSDDMDWVKQNLNIPNCTYVNHNKGKNSYIDMYLMSLCKHNIIANSTFSWWAAWLNKNERKLVIMPERWMNNNSCEEMFPTEWIKMKV